MLLKHTFLSFLVTGASASNATILPSETIFVFPNQTYIDIENVAVRSNGQIMLNTLTSPTVYSLDPRKAKPNATLVHTFTNGTKLDGIVEYRPDVFAIIVGNAVNTSTSTYSIWSLDFNDCPPTASKIANIPGSVALNGLTTITGSYSDTLLVADSKLSAIWEIDVGTESLSVALKNDHFLPTTDIAFGINGVHVSEQTLYFSNSANFTFGSVPISANGTLLGDEMKIIATQLGGNEDYDDFAIDSTGRYAWLSDHTENLVKLDLLTGEQEVVVTGSTNPTAAAFARGLSRNETDVLYVVTMGSKGSPIVSGEVVKVHTAGNSSRSV